MLSDPLLRMERVDRHARAPGQKGALGGDRPARVPLISWELAHARPLGPISRALDFEGPGEVFAFWIYSSGGCPPGGPGAQLQEAVRGTSRGGRGPPSMEELWTQAAPGNPPGSFQMHKGLTPVPPLPRPAYTSSLPVVWAGVPVSVCLGRPEA